MTGATREPTAFRQVDLTNEVCPMTFVKAKLHLERIDAGDALEIVLKEGEQVRNVPASLKNEGHTIERVRRDGDCYYLLVRKEGGR